MQLAMLRSFKAVLASARLAHFAVETFKEAGKPSNYNVRLRAPIAGGMNVCPIKRVLQVCI